MPKVISLGDKRLRVGDKVRSNEYAAEHGVCNSNLTFTVKHIRDDGEVLIGLYSERRIQGWGDLEGLTPPRQGFWASRDCILDNFDLVTNDHIVSDSYKYKGQDLKNKRCTILNISHRMGLAFVEMDEPVGGGSADGQGRAGYCVPVPIQYLLRKENKSDTTENWFAQEENPYG